MPRAALKEEETEETTEETESAEEEKPAAKPPVTKKKVIAENQQEKFDRLVADGAETVVFEGTVYVYENSTTLIPKFGIIALKSALNEIKSGSVSSLSTYCAAVKHLNGVD